MLLNRQEVLQVKRERLWALLILTLTHVSSEVRVTRISIMLPQWGLVKRFAKLAKLAVGDMVAIEVKYHVKCLSEFYKCGDQLRNEQ